MGVLDNREAEANGFVPHDPNKLGQCNVFRSSTCFQELFYWAVLSTACQLWAAEINKLLLCVMLYVSKHYHVFVLTPIQMAIQHIYIGRKTDHQQKEKKN